MLLRTVGVFPPNLLYCCLHRRKNVYAKWFLICRLADTQVHALTHTGIKSQVVAGILATRIHNEATDRVAATSSPCFSGEEEMTLQQLDSAASAELQRLFTSAQRRGAKWK